MTLCMRLGLASHLQRRDGGWQQAYRASTTSYTPGAGRAWEASSSAALSLRARRLLLA